METSYLFSSSFCLNFSNALRHFLLNRFTPYISKRSLSLVTESTSNKSGSETMLAFCCSLRRAPDRTELGSEHVVTVTCDTQSIAFMEM